MKKYKKAIHLVKKMYATFRKMNLCDKNILCKKHFLFFMP